MTHRFPAEDEYVLTLTCPEAPGIVFAVSRFVMEHGGNINASHQFDDRLTDTFFMRVQFRAQDVTVETLRQDFAAVGSEFAMAWQLHDVSTPTRALLMVSKFGHCLNDLLFRTSTGALNIEIPAIVSNHRDFEAVAEANQIPFFHVPVTAETKLEGRAINIHHSFLPSFKGAKPYHQAHARGVKLIGATAHYVTPDLDEGPIIEQDVDRVDHSLDPAEMTAAGRDVEAQVLARAIRWHSEHRVLLHRNRTVVFR